MLLNYGTVNLPPNRNFHCNIAVLMVYSSFVIELVYGCSEWKITAKIRNCFLTIPLLQEVNLF